VAAGERGFTVNTSDHRAPFFPLMVKRGLEKSFQLPTEMDFGFTFVRVDPERSSPRAFLRRPGNKTTATTTTFQADGPAATTFLDGVIAF